MSDQGAETGDDISPTNPEENLMDQFQQQRDKIEEIKKLLKQNEQKLVNREKEVEKYASKLSDIKTRSRAAKHKAAATPKQETSGQNVETPKVEEDQDESSTPRRSGVKKAQGNLVLLRKKLEENRAKFELRGKELNENRKGIEEMVHHLKSQLDERDIKIKELQNVLETHPPSSHLSVLDVSQGDNVSITGEGLEQTQDVHVQIAHKDNKIIELNKKIVDLETKVLDLQENFREKDSVIAARTKAITLMSEDFSRRNKTTVDNLEETREEMRKMQNNFVMQETKMKEEIEELKKELSNKTLRLHQVEETNKDLQSVRFDLSTRNAELQEKVVRIHEENMELQKQIIELGERNNIKEEETDQDSKIQNLQIKLDESNKQITKMKAQHKSKVKALNKQLDSLKKVSDANEEILKLQNKIAELEEDKGNLQLHLVDFDELKVSESHWQTRVLELEERVSQQSHDLDSHIHMITLLEAEKLDHLRGIQEEKQRVSDLEAKIEELKSFLSELENQKLSLEMKTVDLEEQVDILNEQKRELQEEFEKISHLNSEGSIDLKETSEKQNVAESESNKEEAYATEQDTLNQYEIELGNLRTVIEEQKEIITDLNLKINSRNEELELQRDMIDKLEQFGGEDKIMDIVKELNDMASDLEEWKKRCNEVEKRLSNLDVEKQELETQFKDVKFENSILKQQLEAQKEATSDLASKVKDQSNAITNRDQKIITLQSMIELNGQTLEAREVTLKDVHEKLNNVEKQYENRLSELKLVLTNKDEEINYVTASLNKQNEMLKISENHIAELTDALNKQKHEYSTLKKHALSLENTVHQLQTELTDLSRVVSEKDQVTSELAQECLCHRKQIDTLTTELSDKVQYIRRIETEVETLRELEANMARVKESLTSHEEEISMLKTELAASKSEVQENLNKLKIAEEKITELTEKNKKFIANLKAKAVTIKGYEQKLKEYETLITTKENMILELTSINKKLVEEQSNERNVTSQTLNEQTENVKLLTQELTEERTKTELISHELSNATDKIIGLEKYLKECEIKMQEIPLLEEKQSALLAKIANLEREISVIQIDLRNKDDEVKLLNEEKCKVEEIQRNTSQQLDLMSALEKRINNQETELEGLKTEKETLLQQLSISDKSEQLTDVIRVKDLKIEELTEHLTKVSEKSEQVASASEAKLQEREAVIESLELELSKTKERTQHLEERLSYVEERRLSLESKAETLNLRLQESDRVKEEVVENEEMLGQQLQSLTAAEEILREKVEVLNAENEELTSRISELSTLNIDAKRELSHFECNLKELQKEVDRLSPFEKLFAQASEKVEIKEAELKRVVLELEYRMNEKIENIQRYSESLESDLRNVNTQLEKVEIEKKILLEKYEKLNDQKLDLEDDIDHLKEVIASHTSANDELRRKLCSDETEKTFQDKLQFLETELERKTLTLKEKEHLTNELKGKIEVLEDEQKESAKNIESLLSAKEKLNERIEYLERDLEKMTYSGKEGFESNLQERVQYLEKEIERYQMLESVPQNESTTNFEEYVSTVNTELEKAKSIILLKENEIKSYQTRLLQLQFGNAPEYFDHHMSSAGQIQQLEESVSNLQEAVSRGEAQISKLNSALHESTLVIEQLKAKLLEKEDTIKYLEKEIGNLQENIIAKNNFIQQLQVPQKSPSEVSEELMSMKKEYETQLSILEQQRVQLYEELLRTKAQQEVLGIVQIAEDHVHKMLATSESECVQHENEDKTVTFQEHAQETISSKQIYDNTVLLKLEHRVQELEEELLVQVKRNETLQKLNQSSTQTQATGNISVSLVIEDEGKSLSLETAKHMDETAMTENQSSSDSVINASPALHKDPSTETAAVFGYQSWDTVEEEVWGSDEARLEEEHIHKQNQSLLFSEPSDMLLKRVNDLEALIKDIEARKEQISEELHSSQVRSGKMLKKLKDLKLKNDALLKENMELTKKKKEDFSDLNQAIEEELKIQIDTLEKEVTELKKDRESAHIEKDGLLKHIDVLTSANEKFVEIKEKQDLEIEVWKQKNKDLHNQIQSLEWRIGELEANNSGSSELQDAQTENNSFFFWDKQGFASSSVEFSGKDSASNILQQELKSISSDNETLKSLLDEERNARMNAETHLQELQQRLIDVNSEIEMLASENINLRNQVEQLQVKVYSLEQEKASVDNRSLQSAYNTLNEDYQDLYKEFEEKVVATEKKYKEMQDEYNEKIIFLNTKNKEIEDQYHDILEVKDQLVKELESYTDLTKHYNMLQTDYNQLKAYVDKQEESLVLAEDEKIKLQHEVLHLKSLSEDPSLNNSAEMLSMQMVKITNLEKELRNKVNELEMLHQLNENVKLEHAQAEQEWNSKMEHLRKEVEYNSENLLKMQDRYEMLQKEYKDLQNHVDKIIEEVENRKQNEIEFLRTSIAEKRSEELNLKNDAEMEQRPEYSQQLSNVMDKETELQEQLFIKDTDIKNLNIQLEEKNTKINQLKQSLEESRKEYNNLLRVLENHEVHLNESEVESLIPSQRNIMTSVSLKSQNDELISPILPAMKNETEENSSDPQKELDIALYMLHQRDVRCDELTLELMQLLEERDTLQLRLSNALRMNEELRNMAKNSAESSPIKMMIEERISSIPSEESPHHIATTLVVPPSSSNLAVEVEEDLQSLANKLSELRSVGYHRDVTLQDERQQRHNEQVRLLHQRGSGIVVDANYTLSRDVQSPSTVLLNWLWGRSTPRVMHV